MAQRRRDRIVLWMLTTALSWMAAMGLLDASSPWAVMWPAAGFMIGGGQWFLLNRRIPHTRWWIVAYAASWCLALWISQVFGFLQPNILFLGFGGGALAGILQAVALRRQMKRTGLWIAVSAVITFVGCWVGSAAGNASYDHYAGEMTAYLIGGAVGGAVLGVLSGLYLGWFVKLVPSEL